MILQTKANSTTQQANWWSVTSQKRWGEGKKKLGCCGSYIYMVINIHTHIYILGYQQEPSI